MLTIYSLVKPFTGEFDYIQRNAIGSWVRLCPGVEVILFGAEEPGAIEYAAEVGLPIYPIRRNADGVPFVGDLIAQGDRLANHPIHCMVNADIIILPDIVEAIQATAKKFQRFLAGARRWDVQMQQRLIDFSDPAWPGATKQIVADRPRLHRREACDTFIYRGVDWGDVPPFLAGRTCWDNWMIWRAREAGAVLADLTGAAMVIHQNHARPLPQAVREEMAGLYARSVGTDRRYGFQHAHYVLVKTGARMEWEKTKEGKKL